MENIQKQDDTRDLLNNIFRKFLESHRMHIEIRTFMDDKKQRGGATQFFFDSLEKLLAEDTLRDLHRINNNGAGIFFGVAPREQQSGTKNDIKYLTALWVDIDPKENENKGKILKRVATFSIPPSIVNDSGRGIHVYWTLKEVCTEESLVRAESIMRGLAEALGGDHTFDRNRVLRLPGFNNMKNPANPIPCQILRDHFFPERKYSIDDLRQYALPPQSTHRAVNLNVSKTIAVSENFFRLLLKDKKLRETYYGTRRMPNDSSRSAYDMALASMLRNRFFSDTEIEAILRTAPSGKGQEATDQYLRHTISKT